MFLEERISVDVQHGFHIEDDYAVQITKTAGGSEYRRLVHNSPVRIFVCHYIKEIPDMYDSLLSLYHRAFGRFAGFRAKVFDDFSSNSGTGTPTHTDQTLIKLTATTYQLVKRYGTNGAALSIGYPTRTIYKPVLNTIKIGIAGVNILSTDPTFGWTCDYTTGIITFIATPGTAVVTGGFEFDTPVRFDTAIQSRQTDRWRDTSDITLIELLNPLD